MIFKVSLTQTILNSDCILVFGEFIQIGRFLVYLLTEKSISKSALLILNDSSSSLPQSFTN